MIGLRRILKGAQMSQLALIDDVREHIGRYVAREIDLWELDHWLNLNTLNLPQHDPAFPLSREVFLFFAEVTSGHRSEDEVRERIRVAHGQGTA